MARTTTRAFVEDRAKFKAECKARNDSCWLCGMKHIDYDAPHDEYTNDDRFQLDHFYPVSTHPELQHEPSNFRPSAAGCNNARSNNDPRPPLGTLSQQWT